MNPTPKTSFAVLVAAAIVLSGFLAGQFAMPRQAGETFPAARSPDILPKPTSPTSLRYLRVPILIYHSIAPYKADTSPLVREYTVPPESLDAQLQPGSPAERLHSHFTRVTRVTRVTRQCDEERECNAARESGGPHF